jgi:hypothetical protein
MPFDCQPRGMRCYHFGDAAQPRRLATCIIRLGFRPISGTKIQNIPQILQHQQKFLFDQVSDRKRRQILRLDFVRHCELNVTDTVSPNADPVLSAFTDPNSLNKRNTEAASKIYLPLKEKEIRLLKIHPGPNESSMHCSLEIVAEDHLPNYEPLSYVWGSQEAPKRRLV